MNMLTKRLKGFSILELMIVVTIIGILATIAVQKWREYQSKTRDNIRKLALSQVAKALEVYYMKNRSYPNTSSKYLGYGSSHGGKGFTGADGYVPGLAPKYISELPKDPLFDENPDCGNCGYLYKSDGVGYKLLSYLNTAAELNGGPEIPPTKDDTYYDPQRTSTAYSFMVCDGVDACKW